MKKHVPTVRSRSAIVKPLASTGVAMTTMIDVVIIAQTKRGIFQNVIPGFRSLKIVTRKFTPPRIEDVPTIMSPASHRSTEWSCE